ncbi:MAG: hypothetical protein WCT14_09100, partial [Treponemataceae bacterium]
LERDYFRAITEYKRERFNSAVPEDQWYSGVRIAEAYWLSQKYESALSELFALGKNAEKLAPDRKEWLGSSMALNYYGLKLYPNALFYLDEVIDRGSEFSSQPRLYRGVIRAESSLWDQAAMDFETVARSVPEAATGKAATFALEGVRSVSALPRKSELTAALLSTIVPGLGQVYSGHWFDALQAFASVGVSAFAAYGLFVYERSYGGPYVYTGVMATITLTLHSSNIFGAYKTAGYFNQKQREDALRPIRAAVFALPTLGMAFESGAKE